MGDSWRTHKTTLKAWSGTVDVFWDETDTNGQTALVVGAEVTANFYPEGATTGDAYLYGTAIVTGKTVSASFDGMVESTITLQGTGALTTGTAA
jgi:predicted secreted protein